MADWHCKQIPNGQQPIVVCERETLTAEIERLRVENAEQAQGWRAERALADQLADALGNEWPGISNKPYSDVSTAHAATTAALSAWQEARRG